jgi:two-component system CheB/CheR fusion protein
VSQYVDLYGAPLQKKLIELFNYSFSQEVSYIGSAEAISHNNEGFEVLDTKLKFLKLRISLYHQN